MRALVALALAVPIGGCSVVFAPSVYSGGGDARAPDAGIDAAATDAGPDIDAARDDAGVDAMSDDAGTDAMSGDAGADAMYTDGAPSDAPPADGGTDASAPDAGDAGPCGRLWAGATDALGASVAASADLQDALGIGPALDLLPNTVEAHTAGAAPLENVLRRVSIAVDASGANLFVAYLSGPGLVVVEAPISDLARGDGGFQGVVFDTAMTDAFSTFSDIELGTDSAGAVQVALAGQIGGGPGAFMDCRITPAAAGRFDAICPSPVFLDASFGAAPSIAYVRYGGTTLAPVVSGGGNTRRPDATMFGYDLDGLRGSATQYALHASDYVSVPDAATINGGSLASATAHAILGEGASSAHIGLGVVTVSIGAVEGAGAGATLSITDAPIGVPVVAGAFLAPDVAFAVGVFDIGTGTEIRLYAAAAATTSATWIADVSTGRQHLLLGTGALVGVNGRAREVDATAFRRGTASAREVVVLSAQIVGLNETPGGRRIDRVFVSGFRACEP